MSEQETKKVDTGTDEGRLLNADDIILGGEGNLPQRMELKSVVKDGRPGVVWLLQPPAKDVIMFSQAPPEGRVAAMVQLLAKSVVNRDGTRMFTDEKARQLSDINTSVFTELSTAVTEMMNEINAAAGGEEQEAEGKEGKVKEEDELGEASGEATGSASPTNSQAN